MIVFALLGKLSRRRAGGAHARRCCAGRTRCGAGCDDAGDRGPVQDLRRRHRGAARHAPRWRAAARSSRCSAARAAARPRCCGWWRGWTRPAPARSPSTGRRSCGTASGGQRGVPGAAAAAVAQRRRTTSPSAAGASPSASGSAASATLLARDRPGRLRRALAAAICPAASSSASRSRAR